MVALCIERRVTLRSTDTAFERHFEGHTRDVRDAVFLSKHTIASASDDCSIRFWDLTSDQELGIAESHTDYVRTLDRVSEHVIVSGGYDRMVSLWDIRVKLSAPVSSFDAGKQVEKVLFIPERGISAVAAGDIVSLFDFRGINSKRTHGRDLEPLHTMSIHSKTVVGLSYSAAHDTLVTGSFDGRVKFVSLREGAGYAVSATKHFDAPVTAVAVRGDSGQVAVGLGDGNMQIFKVEETATATSGTRKQREDDIVSDRLVHVRRLLSVYQYHRALRVALFSHTPTVIVSTLEELNRRSALHVALSGHNDRAIVQLLRFAVQHADMPDFHRICRATLDMIFEIYGPVSTSSPFFHRELRRAHKRLGDLSAKMEPLSQSVGMLQLVLDDYTTS